VISDRDIYRTANLLIRKHGERAHIHAAMRVEEFQDKGDLNGQRTWLRIIKAIDALRSTRRGDATLH
jgi:hypothetical protein